MAATAEGEKQPTNGQPQQDVSVADLLAVDPTKRIKVFLVAADEESEAEWVMLALRADHTFNGIKAEKLAGVQSPLRVASDETVKAVLGCDINSAGPVNSKLPVIADFAVSAMADFACGANEQDKAFVNANFDDDLISADLRDVVAGDPSPDGKGTLDIKRGIEVGHIFQLGDKYSNAMNCGVLNETGKHQTLTMGCYGIGVSRIVAAAIEQNHDKYGIIWPEPIAPFQVVLIPMNMHKSQRIKEVAEKLYNVLIEKGIDVLFDDRKERPGVMFNDMELIGIPHSIVIGERNLDNQQVEYKYRRTGEKQLLAIDDVAAFIASK
jgi:prolyl-tRNA synthetase